MTPYFIKVAQMYAKRKLRNFETFRGNFMER